MSGSLPASQQTPPAGAALPDLTDLGGIPLGKKGACTTLVGIIHRAPPICAVLGTCPCVPPATRALEHSFLDALYDSEQRKNSQQKRKRAGRSADKGAVSAQSKARTSGLAVQNARVTTSSVTVGLT